MRNKNLNVHTACVQRGTYITVLCLNPYRIRVVNIGPSSQQSLHCLCVSFLSSYSQRTVLVLHMQKEFRKRTERERSTHTIANSALWAGTSTHNIHIIHYCEPGWDLRHVSIEYPLHQCGPLDLPNTVHYKSPVQWMGVYCVCTYTLHTYMYTWDCIILCLSMLSE